MKFVMAVVYMCISGNCSEITSYKVESSKCGTYIRIQDHNDQNGYVKVTCK